jgi:hypothetical protein
VIGSPFAAAARSGAEGGLGGEVHHVHARAELLAQA